MAALQRKLVHKQFNSPMGLYSQENVKATLNRELKAFGGEGIEVDDQITKPLNLANSAVLRAVEEEEQQAKSDFYPIERQSRRRQRAEGDALHHTLHQQLLDQIKTDYLSHQQDITIDRDTVLKINRLATKRHLLKRDHSWPPAELDVVANPDQNPPISCNPSHSIEALREKFQSPTRIIEPTARQVREQRQRDGGSKERSRTPQRVSDLAEVFHQTPLSKGFSAPETKAADVDLGLVAPRCEYYEQLAHKRPTTPTTLPTPVTPYRPRYKRQAYSLERGRSRKRTVGATELPPPKPRTAKPKVQRRCIKLATEVKISYGHDGDSEEDPVSGQEFDLEALPLPPTPTPTPTQNPTPAAPNLNQATTAGRMVIDNLAVKQQQQMALALATNGSISQAKSPSANTRIVPVRVEASRDPPKLSAQQIYDDACSYLQDHDRDHDHDHQEMESPTYVSATGGIKLLQRQASSTPSTPIPPPPPPPPVMRSKAGQDAQAKDKQARRQGGIYSLGSDAEKQHEAHVEIAQLEAKYAHIQQSIAEHLLQIDAYMENAKQALQRSAQTTPVATPTPIPTPPPPPPPPPAPPVRPISSGSNDSWDIFAHRQSPILAVESPLQAILRQIYTRAAGLPTRLSKEIKEATPAEEEAEEALTENVPIVERALEDLHKIAVALEQKPETAELMHVELRTTPAVIEAEHVVIKDVDVDEDMEYRHVSDVIANYEQLAKKEFEEWKEEQVAKKEPEVKEVLPKTELRKAIEEQLAKKALREGKNVVTEEGKKVVIEEEKKVVIKEQKKAVSLEEKKVMLPKLVTKDGQQGSNEEPLVNKELRIEEPVIKPDLQQSKKEPDANTTKTDLPRSADQVNLQEKEASCDHEAFSSNYCPCCDEMRCSPNNWAKLNKADQWRIANLHNEPLRNYKATYEIRSPYISRQISWEDTQSAKEKTAPEKLQRQRSFVEIVTTPATDSPPPPPPPALFSLKEPETEVTWERSRSPSPLPSRRYPAPLIEAPQRSSSPYGLNPVQTKGSPSPVNLPAKFSHVPQLEGHNIGLLVKTATEPLQQSMSASSSMLAATPPPPATPRSAAQPSPFEFPTLDSAEQHKFRSLASFDEVQRDFSVNRSFDNVSPRPYLGIEGYKRVAWPPASEERIIREFTPQPQTQSPAPGSGGYYPQGQGHAPAAAAPPQGPIYNNVQPRTAQPPQNVYNPPAQQPIATANTTQFPDSYPEQQQPVQYTQAQFNRQRSREPVQVPAPSPAPASDAYPNYQSNYQSNYPQEPLQAVNNVGGGWKHIGAPLPKSRSDYTAGGGSYPPFQGSAQQQQPLYQQPQQQQQQYGAPSYDGQQQQQQPAAPWQQQQQQQPQQPAAPWHQQQQQYQPQSQAQAPYQPPQWNQQQQQQPSYQTSPYQQQQQQPSYYPQQNGGSTLAQPQYNSYSQPQLPYSQDQTDLQQQQQPGAFAGQDNSYRGASPGIITLRKEAPVSQQPAPVYTSQPAAVSYQGGSKLRGDLKWPPPEYKEAAARENEERRQLALGPVCRPRRINRDYTPFFAKHQLNNGYPSYKVPPGTQHMFG
uniref:Bromodomain-containing protein 4 isoform X2 n=1 Tax=Drosophila rhopaloa TaxID=1041015 RepID=A0A6P4E163_DRORH